MEGSAPPICQMAGEKKAGTVTPRHTRAACCMAMTRSDMADDNHSPSTNASTLVRPSWRRDSLVTTKRVLAPGQKDGQGVPMVEGDNH